ncbi:MAG: ATP-binding protein, partial [Microbacterium sp.]
MSTPAVQAREAVVADLDRITALLAGEDVPAAREAEASGIGLLQRRLGLSPFERDVLLLAAAVELDGTIAEAVRALQGGVAAPTFALALAMLPDPHWDALSPDGPLRARRLVRLAAGEQLAARPLRIDEPVLHRIAGLGPGRRDGLAEAEAVAAPLTASQTALAAEIAAAVQAIDGRVTVRLDGADADTRRATAGHIAALLGGAVFDVRDAALDGRDLSDASAVIDRECALDEMLVRTSHPQLLPLLETAVVVTDAAADLPGRVTVARTVELPTTSEQAELWLASVGAHANADPAAQAAVRELAHLFRLPARAIAAVAAEWRSRPDAGPDVLRRLARDRSRVGFGVLAQRLEPRAGWDDLVLPEPQLQMLRSIEHQLRHRSLVYEDWGFAATTARGLGVSALFAGESGTGKTMAAEVLAGSLGLDLYRIDLAAVVSKYIGETEKNLGSVFDAAETSGAVLLFDEADALFGKRSEVRDSHDRYANIEINYLLQRMEAFSGLAILASNMKSALDSAFMRRLRFIVSFPFPGAAERKKIWTQALPQDAPKDDLDFERL